MRDANVYNHDIDSTPLQSPLKRLMRRCDNPPMETPTRNPVMSPVESLAARLGIPAGRVRLWTMLAGILLVGVLAMARFYSFQGHLLHGWDGQFYFAEARGFLFGHTADVTETLKQTPWPGPFDRNKDGVMERVPLRSDGRFQSKYPIGLPLVECIFLAPAYALRLALERGGVFLTGPPGLSHFEIWVVALGLFGIALIGLYKLAELCSDWMGKGAWAWPTALAFLGTTLCYYSAIFPFMTHCLSFTVAVYFMAGLRSLSRGKTPNRNLVLLGALAGLLFLIRPQQALLPLLSLPWLLKPLRGRPGTWLPGAVLGAMLSLAAIAATLCYNKAQFGIYTLNGYAVSHERFDFLHPDFHYVLIGSERGLLFYTPLVLLAVPGLILILKQDATTWLLPVMLNALAQIYLVAAWWCPSQGDAFGLRMWTECVPVVAIGMAALPLRSRPVRLGFAAVAVACCMWSGYLLFRYTGWIKGPPLSPEPTCEASPLPRIADHSHPGECPRSAS
jgi:hypothetical protein